MKSGEPIILILIPEDDLRNVLAEALQDYECPYSYEIVSTIQESRKILSKGIVRAIIMTKSVALSCDDGINGLITTQSELPPTVTLIQPKDSYPDYLYPWRVS